VIAAHVSADNPSETSAAAPAVRAPAPPSWAWRRAALILAIAAQLITVSALVGADPPPVTWSSLLLAIAPALLTVPAAFAPAPVNLLAAVAGVAVLAVGIVAQITHTSLFLVPALVVLAVGALKLRREQLPAREGAAA
jgi:hypothetical protein